MAYLCIISTVALLYLPQPFTELVKVICLFVFSFLSYSMFFLRKQLVAVCPSGPLSTIFLFTIGVMSFIVLVSCVFHGLTSSRGDPRWRRVLYAGGFHGRGEDRVEGFVRQVFGSLLIKFDFDGIPHLLT